MRRLLLLLLLLGACMDPVAHDEEDALGPEIAGIPPGPRHRAGQPCTTCHGENRSTGPIMVVAGTVYKKVGSGEAADGARVTITPAKGKSKTVGTNDVGNFYITQEEWPDIVYPLTVGIEYAGDGASWNATMKTLIGRNAGCGRCHQGDGDPSHAQRVFAEQSSQ